MTINDSELSKYTTIIHSNERVIDYYTREGKEHDLFKALLLIHRAAEDAMARLNRMQRDR